MSAAPPRKKVKSIVEVTPESVIGETVTVKGWARTVRAQKALGFLEVNDGSSFGGLQVVFEGDLVSSLKGVGTGCAVSIEGEVVKGGGKQPIELKASSFELVGGCEGDYPLQKKKTFIGIPEIHRAFETKNKHSSRRSAHKIHII